MEVGLHEMDGLHPRDIKNRIFAEIGLVVIDDEFDRASFAGDVETADRVHLLGPKVVGIDLRHRRGREVPGLGYGIADLDRLGGRSRQAVDIGRDRDLRRTLFEIPDCHPNPLAAAGAVLLGPDLQPCRRGGDDPCMS